MVLEIKRQLDKKRKLIFVMGIAYSLFSQSKAFAIDFIFVPNVTLQETYSDNVKLAPKGKETGAFVTELSPGFSLRGVNGGRLTANLDYRLQTLFNAGGDGSTQIFNQLQFDSGYVVSPARFNIGVRSTISQQNITNRRSGDNINNIDLRTNVYTVGTTANWTPHFGSFADAAVNIDFDYVANDNAERLSNSKNMHELISVVSGHDFTRITWVANFDNTNNFRDDADDVRFQNTNATIRGWVDYRFNFFTTVGYANNSFDGLDTSDNGFFYTVGAQWKPSWYFNVEAGYGNNWHVNSNLSLSRRTHIGGGYYDRSVGLNTDGAWNAFFDHRTKRSFWRISYNEDTTTAQDILSGESPFTQFDAEGNLLDSPTELVGSSNPSLPTLTNDIIIRKTAEGSVTYTVGVSVFQLGGFYERRAFNNTDSDKETVYGADASWNWGLTHRTSLYVSPSWQHVQRDTTVTNAVDSREDRYEFVARLTRTLPVNIGRYGLINASLEYFFVKQNSSLLLNTYMENRVTVSLFMSF